MKARLRLFLLAAAAFVGVGAQAATITGSGTAASEVRQVAEFDAIELNGSVALKVRQGATRSVRVEADDNVLPVIETEVSGSTLKVGPRRNTNLRPRRPIVVTVEVPQLKSIDAAGAGDVQVDGMKVPSFALDLSGSGQSRLKGMDCGELRIGISGSGDVEAQGHAASLAISIAGSGDVKASALRSDDVRVRVAGSGNAAVHASKSLDVSIAGSGDVTYGGDATKIKTSVAGSGHIGRQ
jgi:hypothetical protein